jgi:hypothetical protein
VKQLQGEFASGALAQAFTFLRRSLSNLLLSVFFSFVFPVCALSDCPDDQSRPHALQRELSAALIFIGAYPDIGLTLEQDAAGLYLRAGSERLLFSPNEGCPAPWPDSARDQPLCASFSPAYPRGDRGAGRNAPAGFEPGRVRNEAMLKLLYGENPSEVRKNCVPVTFLGNILLFNGRHGAAAALERVGRKLEALVERNPAVRDYILPLDGSFLWRTIAGSGRLSAHSFAIAVDLNAECAPYWRWNPPGAVVQKARQGYPQEVVDAFEAEGFIWGGKWHSFDFMHFEYRPELFRLTVPPDGASQN